MFWQYYCVQQVFQIFSQLLENDPSKKLLPRSVRNKDNEEKFKTEINLQKIRLEKYRKQFPQIDAIMITKFTAKYSNDICDTLLSQWESDCKREKDKSKAIFERKKDWYLNNATTGFCNKYRDESNLEEKGKHGKFTTKFSNNGEYERRNRIRSRTEDRNGNTVGGKQKTPIHERGNSISKEWHALDEQRKYPEHPFKRRQKYL